MKRIVNCFGIAVLVFSLALMTGCTKEPAKPAASSVIVSEPGYYENKTLGISLKYHEPTFTVENELDSKYGQLLNREGPQKVPAVVLSVQAIEDGVALKDMGKSHAAAFQKQYSDADRFKVIETKMVKLASGMDANYSLMKWRFQGTVPLYSACVTAFKNGTAVSVFVTSVPGQPPAEILAKMAMGLNVTL